MRWDIFCKVIDNHGDIGVCWRLACNLARRGDLARLWVDDGGALGWMAPGGEPGVEVLPWQACTAFPPADVVIEAFGCDLPAPFVAAMAALRTPSHRPPAWINLEYLSAEAWVERYHGLPSPMTSGPGAGLVKHFFYPGFTARTGGLLREPDLLQRRQGFDRAKWLDAQGITWRGRRLLSLFCYEPPGLPALIDSLSADPTPTTLLVTAGRPQAAVEALLGGAARRGNLAVHRLPLLPQHEFDHLLWSCDLNLVRGEDSLVRALWAGRPLVWNIYPQDDGVHLHKLDAFLDWLAAPDSLRRFQHGWNDAGQGLPALDLPAWDACARSARDRLLRQDDLATQLKSFVAPLAAGPHPPGPCGGSQ